MVSRRPRSTRIVVIASAHDPHSTTTVRPRNIQLLSRKKLSRLNTESSSSAPRRSPRSWRQASSATLTSIDRPRKVNIGSPISDSAKLCTLLTTPLRVAKVPSTTSRKVVMISSMFQNLSIPRFSCTTALCRKAVPVSQGSSAAFSTGSQPQ